MTASVLKNPVRVMITIAAIRLTTNVVSETTADVPKSPARTVTD